MLAQTFAGLELLVVDDASPDNTEEVVRAFSDPRIRYIRLPANGGASRARNAGILAAGPTKYLAYLDDDDEWMPRKLELQLALFERSGPDLGVVGCGRVDRDLSGTETFMPEHRGYLFEDLLARRARGYAANMALVRRSNPDLLYDEGLRCLEDAEYMFRLSQRWRLDFVPEILVCLRRDDTNEHLWDHAGSIQGHLGVMARYRELFLHRPQVYGHYCACIGRDLWALGRYAEARRWLLSAARATGINRYLWWSAATPLKHFGWRLCDRLLPLKPPTTTLVSASPLDVEEAELPSTSRSSTSPVRSAT
jgi:glycosyltransferase involved in cell wall biosynthesis